MWLYETCFWRSRWQKQGADGHASVTTVWLPTPSPSRYSLTTRADFFCFVPRTVFSSLHEMLVWSRFRGERWIFSCKLSASRLSIISVKAAAEIWQSNALSRYNRHAWLLSSQTKCYLDPNWKQNTLRLRCTYLHGRQQGFFLSVWIYVGFFWVFFQATFLIFRMISLRCVTTQSHKATRAQHWLLLSLNIDSNIFCSSMQHSHALHTLYGNKYAQQQHRYHLLR